MHKKVGCLIILSPFITGFEAYAYPMITILFSPIGDLRSSFLAFHLNVIFSLLDAVSRGISAKIVISTALQQSQITQAEVITQYKNVIEKYLLTWALGDTNFWSTIIELSKSSFRHGDSDFFPLSLTRHEAKWYPSCLKNLRSFSYFWKSLLGVYENIQQ